MSRDQCIPAKIGLLPSERMAFYELTNRERERDFGALRNVFEHEIAPGLKGRGWPLVDQAAHPRDPHPVWNSDRDLPGDLVMNDDFSFVGQIAIHVQPRRSAVQQ